MLFLIISLKALQNLLRHHPGKIGSPQSLSKAQPKGDRKRFHRKIC